MGRTSYVKVLCMKCMKTNVCSCNNNDPKTKIDFRGSWVLPGPTSKKTVWKSFLTTARNNFKSHYILTDNLVTKNAVMYLYAKFNMIDILESTKVREEPEENGEGQQLQNPIAEIMIAIDEEAVAKMGAGLYLKLKFEMARNNDGYPELIIKVLHEKETSVVKIYKQLQRKLKKITGYEFNLRTTGDGTAKKQALVPRWIAEFKLPKALQKIQGDKKVCLRKTGSLRFDYIGDFKTH